MTDCTISNQSGVIAYKIEPGAQAVGVSRSKLYHEQKLGNIEFVKIDGCTLVTRNELVRWFSARAKPAAA